MSAAITVVGLGSGNPDRLTVGILKTMQQASKVYVRTMSHPVIQALGGLGIQAESFDHVYEAHDSFPEVYESIASALMNLAKAAEDDRGIVYAVPGHPMVAEATVRLLRERCPEQQVSLSVLGGRASWTRRSCGSASIRSKAFSCWMRLSFEATSFSPSFTP